MGAGVDPSHDLGGSGRLGLERGGADAAFLALKPAASELGLQSFLRGAPANLLVKYRDDASLAAQIQSRLQAEGTSFEEVEDAPRRVIAFDLQSSSSRAVGNVAAEVGSPGDQHIPRCIQEVDRRESGRLPQHGTPFLTPAPIRLF